MVVKNKQFSCCNNIKFVDRYVYYLSMSSVYFNGVPNKSKGYK